MCYDCDNGEEAFAVCVCADDALGCYVRDGSSETFEWECDFAVAAFEGQADAVFEADGVWNLAFERGDFLGLARSRGGGDAVFAGIEAETFGEMDSVCAWHGRAETLDGWEDLLVQVPFYIWFQRRIGCCYFRRCKGSFGCGLVRSTRCGSGGHDVGNHVVDADRFTLGECSKGDLDLWHAVGVGVVLRIFTKFLKEVRQLQRIMEDER